jgi:hypothetical protein
MTCVPCLRSHGGGRERGIFSLFTRGRVQHNTPLSSSVLDMVPAALGFVLSRPKPNLTASPHECVAEIFYTACRLAGVCRCGQRRWRGRKLLWAWTRPGHELLSLLPAFLRVRSVGSKGAAHQSKRGSEPVLLLVYTV